MSTELKDLAQRLLDRGYGKAGDFLYEYARESVENGDMPNTIKGMRPLRKGVDGVKKETPFTDALADRVRAVVGRFGDNIDLNNLFTWKHNSKTPEEWRKLMEVLLPDQKAAVTATIGTWIKFKRTRSPLEAREGMQPPMSCPLGEMRVFTLEELDNIYGFDKLRAHFAFNAFQKKASGE